MKIAIAICIFLFLETSFAALPVVPVVSNGEIATPSNLVKCRLFTNITQDIDLFSVKLFNGLADLLTLADAGIAYFEPHLPRNDSIQLIANVVYKHFNIDPNSDTGFLSKMEGLLEFFGFHVDNAVREIETVLKAKVTELMGNLFTALSDVNAQIQKSLGHVNDTATQAAKNGNPNAPFCKAYVVPSMTLTAQMHSVDLQQNCAAKYNGTVGQTIAEIRSAVGDLANDFEVFLEGLGTSYEGDNIVVRITNKAIDFVRDYILREVKNFESMANTTIARIDNAKAEHSYCTSRVVQRINDFHHAYNSTLHDCLTNWS